MKNFYTHRKKRPNKILMGAICALLVSQGVKAQTDVPKDTLDLYTMSLQELMEIPVVTAASNVVSEKDKQPVSITSITQRQLQMSGARTLSEALMMFVPGFFSVEDQDDVIAGFRGLAPDNNSKVMLLVNGQNLNTEWFWGPPDAILNGLNFDYIQQVDVIRGPGSVTLGQGALLGVINIITQKGTDQDAGQPQARVFGLSGANGYLGAGADARVNSGEVKTYFHASSTKYAGQAMRNEGWARDKGNEGIDGGKVSDIGTRLKHADNTTIIGNVVYKGWEANITYADQERDLYNFYRDRNRFRQTLMCMSIGNKTQLSEKLQLKTNVNYAWDNFALSSVKGTTMGGTRENRADLSTMLIANELIAGNRLAVGVQYRRFGFGRNNFQGNNFIVNVIDSLAMASPSAFIKKANMEKTLGYERDINVVSVFAEDYQKINEKIDVFAAFRYDNHPFWGSNISPRLGAIISPTEKIRFRLSYQKGFRGAVGLHYGGGYKQDGFLQADNYSQVAAAQITTYNAAGAPNGIEPNISKVKPEIMNSIELAAYYKFNDRLSFEAVGFYNTIQNVIDVGVIYRDRAQMNVPNIGSDVPGDWNGYWYFKNTEGNIKQYGTEAALRYGGDKINISLSHSLVKLASSSEQQRGSMYLSKGNNFKAYPENVTRINIIVTPIDRFSLGLNYMYYYSWYSPSDQKVDGNHLLNLTGMVDVTKNIQASFTVRNVLGESKLYPMNSNVGDANLSDGTPSVESPSFIFRVGYKF